MKELITLLIIAIALSMDTFSLSLGLGTTMKKQTKLFFFPLIVGIMHFVMPIIGDLLGEKIIFIFTINCNFLLAIILLYLAITMIVDLIKHKEEIKEINLLNMFILAVGVSLDSFSTGLGMQAITSNVLLAVTIFSITSLVFTYLGLLIGKYATKLLGLYANFLGAIILICIGVYFLLK